MALLFGNTDGEPLDYSNWRAPSMAAWCGKSRTQGAQIPQPEKDERMAMVLDGLILRRHKLG